MDNTPQQATPEAQETPEESPLGALEKLAQAAKLQRLSPAEEDRAVTLLLPLLRGGKSGITSVVETLVTLPWIVSVNAVSTIWPEWTAVMRRHLLSGLAKVQSDQALRLRLSLARAIFKIEPPAALKIAAATLPDLLDTETGTLTPKHRQIFFNVLIGKGKPWLLQLPLGEFKASEADTLVHCAIETFPFCPPLSQFSILRWTHAGGRFKKISDPDLATITKSISRWNGKLQRQLKAEIEDLPEAITAVFKPAPAPRPEEKAKEAPAATQEEAEPISESPEEQPASTEAPAETPEAPGKAAPRPDEHPRRKEREREERRSKRDRRGKTRESQLTPVEEAEELPEDEEDLTEEVAELEAIDGSPAAETGKKQLDTAATTNATPEESGDSDDDEKESRSRTRDRRRERDERRAAERAERVDRTERSSSRQKAPFDFKESLRGLETYVSSLRSELEQAKVQLRRKEEDTRRSDRRRGGGDERLPVDVEALQKHNAHLEQAVADLRQQLEDLASHHEAIAESRDLHGNEPLPADSASQLRKLFSIKLQEDYETYTAMRLEPLDRVFRLDYRDLLGQVFDVLIEQGVELRAATPHKS